MISVIVPIYNVEKYLEKCIHSIQENTYKDLEILCVNDGSPDHCLEILRRLSEEDPRIVIIDQKNQGVQKARNNALAKAKGEYIALIDSDDWIHPQYFQCLVECMESTGADVAVCGCQKFYEGEEVEAARYQHFHFQKLSDAQFFKSYYARHMCWGRLYSKRDLEGIFFVPEVKTGDDTLFNLCVISNMTNPVVYMTDAPLYFYFQRSNSIVNTTTFQKMIGFPEWAAENHRVDEQKKWSWMLPMQAMKMALSYRYATILHKDRSGTKHANKVMNTLFRMIFPSRLISLKDKIIHVGMFLLPGVYRYFRIKDDPTMKIWEASVKSRQ